jgi:hypothetical protein
LSLYRRWVQVALNSFVIRCPAIVDANPCSELATFSSRSFVFGGLPTAAFFVRWVRSDVYLQEVRVPLLPAPARVQCRGVEEERALLVDVGGSLSWHSHAASLGVHRLSLAVAVSRWVGCRRLQSCIAGCASSQFGGCRVSLGWLPYLVDDCWPYFRRMHERSSSTTCGPAASTAPRRGSAATTSLRGLRSWWKNTSLSV